MLNAIGMYLQLIIKRFIELCNAITDLSPWCCSDSLIDSITSIRYDNLFLDYYSVVSTCTILCNLILFIDICKKIINNFYPEVFHRSSIAEHIHTHTHTHLL